jgi:hypothetical protein
MASKQAGPEAGEAKPHRTTVSELARTLAERRSAATAYINVKVSAQGALQPDVNVTPDTSEDDMQRMVRLAKWAVNEIMAEATTTEEPAP